MSLSYHQNNDTIVLVFNDIIYMTVIYVTVVLETHWLDNIKNYWVHFKYLMSVLSDIMMLLVNSIFLF